MIQKLAIDLLECDPELQPRAKMRGDWAKEYERNMEAGATFPPVEAFSDGGHYWLADGFHRRQAAVEAGLSEILTDIREGTRREALLHSLSANAKHGHRPTNEDKRRAVDTMLQDLEWSQRSDSEIARQIGVDHKTVANRRHILGISQDNRRTVSRRGTTYKMKTSKIGRGLNIGGEPKTEVNVSQVEQKVQLPGPPVQHLVDCEKTVLGDLVAAPQDELGALKPPEDAQSCIAQATNCYSILYADPWHTITTLDDLCTQPVPAAKNSVLFVWAPVARLEDAMRLIKEWKFQYKEHLVWHQGHGEVGHCVQIQHELLLVGFRGEMPIPIPGTEHPSISGAAAKEDIAGLIAGMFPHLSKAHLFAQKPWVGWDVWQPVVGGDDVTQRQLPHCQRREGDRTSGRRSCAIHSVYPRCAQLISFRPRKPARQIQSQCKKLLHGRPPPFSGPSHERRPRWRARVGKELVLMDNIAIGPSRAWEVHVENRAMTAWFEQSFHRPADREEGSRRLLQRRPDFPDHARALSGFVDEVAPLLSIPGQLSASEYETHLRERIYRRLPFLETQVREELARDLVADHARLRQPARVAPQGEPTICDPSTRRGRRKRSAPADAKSLE
jgi:N6-adenosine-specific RNA methylase IME4